MNGTTAYYLNQLPPELTHGLGAIISLIIVFKIITFIISMWGYQILIRTIGWLIGFPLHHTRLYDGYNRERYRPERQRILITATSWFFRWIFSIKQKEQKPEINNPYEHETHRREGPILTAYPMRYPHTLSQRSPPSPPEIIPEPIVEELEEMGPDALEQPVDAARVARQAEYREFLKSDKWLALREEALNRDGRRCRYCNSVDHLEVHHRYYPKVRGTETVDALTTICHRCHSILSAAKQRNKTNLADGQSSEP